MRWQDVLYLVVIIALVGVVVTLVGQKTDIKTSSSKVALIDIQGTIAGASSPLQTATTPDKVRSLTKRALSQNVAGIIYRINSPGGTVVTSKDVYRIISNCGVPTVCLMKDYAASGAYWSSLGCDKIIADPLTITGNIGAKSSYLEYSGLLKKLGIEHINLTSGKFKGMGSPLRNITDQEKEMLLANLEQIEEEFLATIHRQRGLSADELKQVSDGRILLGREAHDLNLIDYLGGRDKAKGILKKLANVKQVKMERLKQEQGLTELLSRLFVKLGEGIGHSLSQAQGSKITAKYG